MKRLAPIAVKQKLFCDESQSRYGRDTPSKKISNSCGTCCGTWEWAESCRMLQADWPTSRNSVNCCFEHQTLNRPHMAAIHNLKNSQQRKRISMYALGQDWQTSPPSNTQSDMGDLKALCEIICGGDLFWIYASWETTVSKLDENRTSAKEPGKIVRKPLKMVSSVARSLHQQAQQISVKIDFIATYASKICKHRKENTLRLSRTLGFLPRFWQMAQGGRRSLLQQGTFQRVSLWPRVTCKEPPISSHRWYLQCTMWTCPYKLWQLRSCSLFHPRNSFQVHQVFVALQEA